jgi:hypothetical protein
VKLDLDAIEARHWHDESMRMCSLCMFEWPCDAVRMVAEVRRLRAALDEAFDLDQLPIPYVVNYLVDLWHDHDGYDPGDTTEVLDALLSAITSASAPAGGHVLDLPRVGEADRG